MLSFFVKHATKCSHVFCCAAVALACSTGCFKSTSGPAPTGGSYSAAQSDNLTPAVDYLRQLDDLDARQARSRLLYHLNQWIAKQPAGWSPDPLVDRLPVVYRGIDAMSGLDKREFSSADVDYLQHCQWLRDIAQWVSQKPADPSLARWLEKLPTTEGGPERLVTAYKLFDWTVRNIQLDPLLDDPQGTVAGPAAHDGEAAGRDDVPPPARGIAGPGYTYRPGHVLLYGHGDAWQRARVFILLARQLNIDVVMLATRGNDPASRPRPWLPAVLLDGRLYLFDTALGLAVPAERSGVATLQDVTANPDLLRALDFGNYSYPVTPSDLEHVVALIDASPAALSLRMKTLAANLTGESRLVLSVSPSALAKTLQSIGGIKRAEIWTLPLETEMYRAVLPETVQADADTWRAFFRNELVFLEKHPAVRGRKKHFHGQFADRQTNEGSDRGLGAISHYLDSLVSDDHIDKLETDGAAQQELGLIRQEREPDQVWRHRLWTTQTLFRELKSHAGYWLSLAHFEQGNYGVAASWLEKQTAASESRWQAGAGYNLARTYEATGRIEDARKIYLADDSAQRHGNLLRARLLREFPAP